MCMINKADWSISLIISLLTGYTRSDFLWLYLHMYVVYVTCGILPSPPPFPKDYYYIIIKSKQFNYVKNKDDDSPRTGELAPLTINVLLFVGAVVHGCLPILCGFSQRRPVLLAVVRYSLFLWRLTNFWLLAWPFLKLNVTKIL